MIVVLNYGKILLKHVKKIVCKKRFLFAIFFLEVFNKSDGLNFNIKEISCLSKDLGEKLL